MLHCFPDECHIHSLLPDADFSGILPFFRQLQPNHPCHRSARPNSLPPLCVGIDYCA